LETSLVRSSPTTQVLRCAGAVALSWTRSMPPPSAYLVVARYS
jgi:hypothetical protein